MRWVVNKTWPFTNRASRCFTDTAEADFRLGNGCYVANTLAAKSYFRTTGERILGHKPAMLIG